MDRLPLELLVSTAGYLANGHWHTLRAFSLVNKHCRAAAAFYLFTEPIIRLKTFPGLQKDVKELMDVLTKYNSLQRVTFLRVERPAFKTPFEYEEHEAMQSSRDRTGLWLMERYVDTVLDSYCSDFCGWDRDTSTDADTAGVIREDMFILIMGLIEELPNIEDFLLAFSEHIPASFLRRLGTIRPKCRWHLPWFVPGKHNARSPDDHTNFLLGSSRLASVGIFRDNQCASFESQPYMQKYTFGRLIQSMGEANNLCSVTIAIKDCIISWSGSKPVIKRSSQADASGIRSTRKFSGPARHEKRIFAQLSGIINTSAVERLSAQITSLNYGKAFEWWETQHKFPNLADLAVIWFGGAPLDERTLPPLVHLLHKTALRRISTNAFPTLVLSSLTHHGCLTDLELGSDSLIPEDLELLHLECPLLIHLSIKTRRTWSHWPETAMYSVLSTFDSLKSLRLGFDCESVEPSCESGCYGYDPMGDESGVPGPRWDQLFALFEEDPRRVVNASNRKLVYALLNMAIDEDLIRQIWRACGGTRRKSKLEVMHVRCEETVEDVPMALTRELSPTWRVSKHAERFGSNFVVNKIEQPDGFEFSMDDLEEDLYKAIDDIWPANPENEDGNGWGREWSSLPLKMDGHGDEPSCMPDCYLPGWQQKITTFFETVSSHKRRKLTNNATA